MAELEIDLHNLTIRLEEEQHRSSRLQHELNEEIMQCAKYVNSLDDIRVHMSTLNDVRYRRHTVLDFEFDQDAHPRAKWNSFLGVHPTDTFPLLRPQPISWLGVTTYDWGQPYPARSAVAVYDQLFDKGEVVFERKDQRIHTHSYAKLWGSGFFIGQKDNDPPDPKWYDGGVAKVVGLWRTSVFDSSLSQKNDNVKATLKRWWKHIDFVHEWLEELDKTIALSGVGGDEVAGKPVRISSVDELEGDWCTSFGVDN